MAGEVVCDLSKLLFCGEILCDALDKLGHQEEAVSVARVELGQVILYITSVAELGILFWTRIRIRLSRWCEFESGPCLKLPYKLVK